MNRNRRNRPKNWTNWLRTKTFGLVALISVALITISACSSGPAPTATAEVGISPELVTDYIHTVLEADRTAYTKHVISRLTKLEGKEKPDGVVDAEATEAWKETGGVPLPAQMFRLGSEIALEADTFTYGLISSWNINDNQAPRNEFEKTAMKQVEETSEPYKDFQEIAGQRYYSALYPDVAVAEACVTCHNEHPVHKERYPDKVFVLGDVMGGVMINLPLGSS
ncbi:hypothetical protein Pse7367_2665 [Thalassoporum mexicanum PCC 7367]|uniref:Tll0287-like domain-containing protein n=1 Tax=Thalassoporum mexicanum TaxID=3457544 RepID=UPI00029FFD4D|nr:DUF3365 domain-containing protein [Pseudanabaena sp. PCC 7367]AFY70920.1 hypothetical protein Pse7367_2665 [Pseudanabaena sp. PCC 7367]